MKSKVFQISVLLFVFLNFIDFLLTMVLLKESKGVVFETNPIAVQVIRFKGWLGLGALKIFCSALAIASIACIPKFARKIFFLNFCNIGIFIVNCYSAGLLVWLYSSSGQAETNQISRLENISRGIENESAKMKPFNNKFETIIRSIREKKMGLTDGTRNILNHEGIFIPDWLKKIHCSSGCNWPEIEVAKLIMQVIIPDELMQHQLMLLDDFEKSFGIDYLEIEKKKLHDDDQIRPDEQKIFPSI
jgi:hypothetical protein